jgi:hypothetical protein
LPDDQPSVVVLDEMPYLIRTDPGFEGTLQKVFDRELSRKPVLLIGIGSDLAMMEALNEYGRPFHQRATELVIPPLSPADVTEMLALPAAEAFDAYLVSGGLPLVLDEWPSGRTALDYVAEAVADPLSALLVSGERALAAEFPPDSQARLVLGAIGSGERTYSKIQRAAGGMPASSLNRALDLLAAKRIVDVATPLSARPSRQTRYSVGDPHLPGTDETTPLLVVSRAGIAVDGPVALLPEDLLAAWRGCLRWRGECPEADRTASAAPDAQGGPAGVSESMAGLGRTDHREDVRETIRG